MIRLCDNIDIINMLEETSPFIIKIKSLVKAYGLEYDFLQVWYQEKALGEKTSLIAKFDGAIVIHITDESDFTELLQFFKIIGYKSLLLDKKYSYHFNIDFKFGKIMKLSKNLTLLKNVIIDKNIEIRKIYFLLQECSNEKFKVPDFEPFYLDISHRIRHNTARCYAISDNKKNKYIACAITSSETDKNAILSAVAVSPNSRRKGYGNIIVKSICSDLQKSNKDIYIYRQENENFEFYKSLGFMDYGEWAEYNN